MKPWIIVLIVVLGLAVIGVIIWAANKSAKQRKQLEEERKTKSIDDGEDGGKVNIWTLISGLTGVLAESGLGEGEQKTA